jgi:hypothetical protein
VLVVLQDGRQLDGELHSMSGRFEIGGVTFDGWEIAEITIVCGTSFRRGPDVTFVHAAGTV